MENDKIQYIYEILDRYSPVLAKMADAQKKLAEQTEKTDQYLKTFEGRIKTLGDQATKLGKQMSLKLTAPIVALGTLAVHEWNQQEAANARVRAALATTGARVGRTFEDLEAQASKLAKTRLFSDDTILASVTVQLLKFGRISGDIFDRAQVDALDLAAFLKIDAASAAQKLGLALNSPLQATRLLRQAGIALSKQQEGMIKSLVNSGQIEKAQRMLLGLFEGSGMKGQAEAQAQAGIGPALLAKQNLFDSLERLGGVIFKILVKLVPLIDRITDTINAMTPGQLKWVVILGGLAAAFGPLLILLGLAATAITVLSGPVGLTMLAIIAITGAVTALILCWDDLMTDFKASGIIGFVANQIDFMADTIFRLLDGLTQLTANPIVAGFTNGGLLGAGAGMAQQLSGNINLNLNAPKGTVKSVSANFDQKVSTGVNMRNSGMGGGGFI